MNIPTTFRPVAKAKAERLLQYTTDEDRQQRIINEISEDEWRLDRTEWRNWMDMMRGKFSRMQTTPQERKRYWGGAKGWTYTESDSGSRERMLEMANERYDGLLATKHENTLATTQETR